MSEKLPHHLDGSLFGADNPCFGCSPHHPYGFHLKLERDGDDGVKTRFTPSDKYQGPPGILHGGLVLTLADEIAAWAILARCGKFGFTASFEGRFRAPVRIGIEALGWGKVVKETSRVVRVHVRIEQPPGPEDERLRSSPTPGAAGEGAASPTRNAECFDGTLTFAMLDRSGAERLLKAPLPEAWAKYAR